MPVFDENDTSIKDFQGPPGFTRVRSGQTGAWSIDKAPSIFSKIPFIPIILGILVVLVGVGVYFLGGKLSELRSEVGQLKEAREQVADLRSGFNTRIASVSKEQHKLQSEIAHLKGEIEAMKGRQKREAEAAAQKQAVEAKKRAEKQAPAKKGNGKEKRA